MDVLKAWAADGSIVLLFQDESTCLTLPYLYRIWALPGEDLRLPTPGKAYPRHIFGGHEHISGKLFAITRPRRTAQAFVDWLRRVDRWFGPDVDGRPVFVVLDNAQIHTCPRAQNALDARWPWLHVIWLPKHASDLNDIERDWLHLKRNDLAHLMFTTPEELDLAIRRAIRDFNRRRELKYAS